MKSDASALYGERLTADARDCLVGRLESSPLINVFVHLAPGFGGKSWNEKYKNGQIVGINEPFAYGYHKAADYGCRVTYCEDKSENELIRLARLGLRFFLKFDIVHAWRNRKGICAADVVWTHAESHGLAVLCLLSIMRPKVILQLIWLLDRWRSFPAINRWLIKRLVNEADIFTVHSPFNLKLVRQLLPKRPSELVLFAIRTDGMRPVRVRAFHHPIRIVSLGNDEHRDWETLVKAIKNAASCHLRIASGRVDRRLVKDVDNIEIVRPASNQELSELYEWADVVVLALKPNLHASGITTVQEAVLLGIPVICTDTGGLGAYFSGEEIKYVPPQNCEKICAALAELNENEDARIARARRAQDRMGSEGLSSDSFVKRHVEISRRLLSA